jgi:hypothetical protein
LIRNRTLLADETVYGKVSVPPLRFYTAAAALAAGGGPLLVFAAASLRDALVDVFFSADRVWMRVKIAPGCELAGALWS